MPRSLRYLLALAGFALLAFVPLGCSDDDDPAAPAGPTDQTAPLVMGFAPTDRLTDVPVDEAVVIQFNEAMDTATADGNVTLSAGAISSLDWNSAATQLTVTHADWPQGTPITVTVGTGVKDAAGNALPQAFSVLFYTYSATPVVLDTVMPGGEDAMVTNGSPVFLFSEVMDVLSVDANLTVTDAKKKAIIPRVVGYGSVPESIEVSFPTVLEPQTTYTITIDEDAATASMPPQTLGSDIVQTFTTGAGADDTAPFIESTVPTAGTTVATDLATATVTFSESIDITNLRPTEMSALLQIFMAREPVWNADYSEMTIYLQTPLPAGVDLYAVFGIGSIEDLAGNPNTEEEDLSFTTQGTASYLPVRGDLKIYYETYSIGDMGRVRRTLESISGGNFDRVINEWGGTSFNVEADRMRMTMGSGGLTLRNVVDGDGTISFSPAVPLLPLPVQESWDGTSTATRGGESAAMSYYGESGEPQRVSVYFHGNKDVGTTYWLDDCLTVDVHYTMMAGETLVESGGMNTTYAPGLGIYNEYSYGSDGGMEGKDYWEDSYNFYGAALDDRYEDSGDVGGGGGEK